MSDLIPDPETVHERLREVLREAAVLRRLLRLAVRARDAHKADSPSQEGAIRPKLREMQRGGDK